MRCCEALVAGSRAAHGAPQHCDACRGWAARSKVHRTRLMAIAGGPMWLFALWARALGCLARGFAGRAPLSFHDRR
eukprot:2899854-Heterocapsa_arctica.AAC.1